jgi:predicted nucleic acid-binding protein
MRAYPDTSFLCALYVKQTNSPMAATHAATMKELLCVTDLLTFDERQRQLAQAEGLKVKP